MKKDQTVDYLRIVADYEKKRNRKQKEPDSIPDEDVYRWDTVDYMAAVRKYGRRETRVMSLQGH